ncbi:MAG: hypothetical protein AAGH41_03520 [Pseudomonadota bacterium]
MTFQHASRAALLLSAMAIGLAACSGSGEVQNSGATGAVTVVGGGQGNDNSDVQLNFVGGTCPTGTFQDVIEINNVDITTCVIAGGILTSNLTLTSDNTYALDGAVFVGENVITDPNGATAQLTIDEGTVIFGLNGEDVLVVSPGSRLIADGSPTAPIIFTSAADVADAADIPEGNRFGDARDAVTAASDGLSNGVSTARGQWGGLVLSGLAPINDCDDAGAAPGSATCNKDGEGGSGLYGGNNPGDDSGLLEYVRVQYAGFLFSTDDELNGIAFQGTGSGTVARFLQVHNNADDGIEWFGGTTNANNVVVTGSGDDSLDWTDGWQGEVQFALVVQGGGEGNRGIEGDNRNGDNAVAPVSDPIISNFTFIGDPDAAGADDGVKLRRGTVGDYANGIVVNFAGQGFDYDAPSAGQDSSDRPTVNSMFFASNVGGVNDSDAQALIDAGTNIVSAAAPTLNGVFSGPAEQAVPFTDPGGDTVQTVDYIGAFEDSVQSVEDSWLADWILVQALPNAGAVACPEGTSNTGEAVPRGRIENNICEIPTRITGDLRLTRGNLYTLAGATFVGFDRGPDPVDNPLACGGSACEVGTLTIEPGVTVYSTGDDPLVVTRGSRIIAEGTADAPIVFTSRQDVFGLNVARGQWGGLVLNGAAPINDAGTDCLDPTDSFNCEKEGEGGSGLFGGGVPTDSSGSLRYVRVQYAGFLFSTDDELNGIAFQGTGSGTHVDFVQVADTADDGIEWFGGRTNARHIVITGSGDDSLDWTDGWQGNVQYAIVLQRPGEGNRGIEGDNRNGDNAVEPQSAPDIANFTFIGTNDAADADDGIKLRRGTIGRFGNGIITEFVGNGLDYDEPSNGQDNSLRPSFVSIVVDDTGGDALDSAAAALPTASNVTTNIDTVVGRDSAGNVVLFPGAELDGVSAFDPTTWNETGETFFEAATYLGAEDPSIDPADAWIAGWTIDLN